MVFPSIAELQNHQKLVNNLGRNDKCWCGSDKKHKKCHLGRENQTPLTRQEIYERSKRIYADGWCFHPKASPSTCKGEIIKAHTIRRSGDLKRIAHKGQVYNSFVHGRMFDKTRWTPEGSPSLVGTRKASRFAGFCAKHDNDLFAPLEKTPFTGSPLQIALLGYRAICHEIYLKESELANVELMRDLDKGLPPYRQYEIQMIIRYRSIGVTKGIQDLKMARKFYDEILLDSRLDSLDYFIVEFGKTPEILCNAIVQSTHDFRGNQIQNLGDFGTMSRWLAFTLLASPRGGAAVFSWPRGHRESEQVITTLNELSDKELPHAIVRFTFEFFENTYFSPDWWGTLVRPAQIALRKRQLNDIAPMGLNGEFVRQHDCLLDDGIRAVDWPVISRRLSIGSE